MTQPVLLSLLGFLVGCVALEGAGRSELTKLVTDHILADQYRYVLTTVVDSDRQADHFREYHGTPGPGLDRALDILRDRLLYLLGEVMIDERAFHD